MSNRRHAISIAMKLYQSFTYKGGKNCILEDKEVSTITEAVTDSIVTDTSKILNWIKTNNTLSKKEEIDIREILQELNTKKSNSKTFYKFHGKTFYLLKFVECLAI